MAYKIIFLTFAVLTSFSLFAEELSIKSNPEQAEVFVKNATTKQRVKIGKTPMKIPMAEAVSNFAGGASVFIVEIAKEGFEPYRVLLTRTGSNNIDLNVNLDVAKNIKMVKELDFLMAELFDVQRQIRSKSYSEAIGKLSNLEKDYPHYSIIYELKGSAFYLSKDFKKALAFYRKAFSVNPENRDAYIMKLYLEKKFNLTPVEKN